MYYLFCDLLPVNYPILPLVSVMTYRKLSSGIHGKYSSLTHKKNHTHSFSSFQKKNHHKRLLPFSVPSCSMLLAIPLPHLNGKTFCPYFQETLYYWLGDLVDFSQLFLFICLKYCYSGFHNHSLLLATRY